MKATYKLTYLQACCLRDFMLKITEQVKPVADELLAQQVLVAFILKLNNRLLYQYPKTKSITLPATASLSLMVLVKKLSLNDLNAHEKGVVTPIINDCVQHLVNLRTITT